MQADARRAEDRELQLGPLPDVVRRQCAPRQHRPISATRRLTKGQGAQVVFDAVGGPLFEPALRCLAHRGIEITSAGDRRVSFDLLDFYHNESRLFGVDTRKRDATASVAELEALTPFF